MFRLGRLQIDSPFVQAALSGYSDLPMRRLARAYGADYTLNEVVLDKLVLQPGKNRGRLLDVTADDHPVGGQIMGADPDQFGPAALAMARAGYDVIDINFGCPVRKALTKQRGGHLMSQPDTALDIVRRVHQTVGSTIPVTVKMRRGYDDRPDSERNFFRILDGALEIGVSAVTLHGRTVEQRYNGPSNWGFVARVKKHVGDKVLLGSGDLFSATDCIRMIDQTGVDGVSIARGCIGNPWIFEECRALLAGEDLPPPPSIAMQRRAIAVHWEESTKVHGQSHAARLMRKFGIKYSEHHPLARVVRDAFIAVKSATGFGRVLDQWYDPNSKYPPVRRREGHGNLVAAGAEA